MVYFFIIMVTKDNHGEHILPCPPEKNYVEERVTKEFVTEATILRYFVTTFENLPLQQVVYKKSGVTNTIEFILNSMLIRALINFDVYCMQRKETRPTGPNNIVS